MTVYPKNKIARLHAEYKEAQGCMDCGGAFPFYQLQFEHPEGNPPLHPTRRSGSTGITGIARNQAEALTLAQQCDVVCMNCHGTRTYERRIAKQAL